jgi:hypothetical protein
LLTGKNKEYVLPGWTGWEYNILRRRASGEQHSPALRWQKNHHRQHFTVAQFVIN